MLDGRGGLASDVWFWQIFSFYGLMDVGVFDCSSANGAYTYLFAGLDVEGLEIAL